MRKIIFLLILLSQLYFPFRGNSQDTIYIDISKPVTAQLDIPHRDTIYLNNASFEDIPRRGGQLSPAIKGWDDCGIINFPTESPPDIHPIPKGGWGVEGTPQDGDTYLGLVIRDNASWESVSQKLTIPISPGKCYSFHAYLSLSPVYKSGTKLSPDVLQDFSHPAVLRIWGGNDYCDEIELLARSYPVTQHDWKEFSFEFKPAKEVKFITLEAFYYTPEPGPYTKPIDPYNGHIMIDHLSPIIEVECK